MLKNNSTRLLGRYERNMFGGNTQWADPEEALRAGEIIGEELVARFENLNGDVGDSPKVRACASKVLEAACEVIDYAALPTERRVNLLHGVVNALGECGMLGGKPEWAEAESHEAIPDTEQ